MERNPYSSILTGIITDFFIGRQLIKNSILDGVTRPLPVSYGITGLRGSGKSTFLQHLNLILGDYEQLNTHLQNLAKELNWGDINVPNVIPIYIDFGGSDASSVLHKIYTAIGSVLQEYKEEAFDMSKEGEEPSSHIKLNLADFAEQLIDSTIERMQKIRPHIVLLLDDFDMAYTSISEENELRLRQLLPLIPAVIVTEQPWTSLKKDNIIRSPLFRYVEMIRLEPFSPQDISEFNKNLRLKEKDFFSDKLLKFALDLSGGIPLIFLNVVRAFYDMKATEEDIYNIEKDIKLYEKFILRLITSYGLKDVFILWWEWLVDREKEVLSQLAINSKSEQKFDAIAIERLLEWNLIRDEGRHYRIGPSLFSDYIRLLERPIPQQRRRATVDDRLLTYLQEHSNELCTYEELLKNVWGEDLQDELQTGTTGRRVDNAIMRLRKRLGRDAIETIYGKGIRYMETNEGE